MEKINKKILYRIVGAFGVLVSSFFIFHGGLFAQTFPAPQIKNVRIVEMTSSTAVIQWETDKDADGLINYGLDPFYGISRDTNYKTKQHRVELKDLEPSTKYFFRIISADESANQGIAEGYGFVTQASKKIEEIEKISDLDQRTITEKVLELLEQIKDIEAFELIAKRLEELTEGLFDPVFIIGRPRVEVGSDYAEFYWVTDRESNSIVELAPEREYNLNSVKPYTISQGAYDELVTEHLVRVIGLVPATKYHYRVVSNPPFGAEGASPDAVFTTKAVLPSIAGVSLDKVEEDSATISWRTNIPTKGLITYKNLTTGEELSVGDPTFLATHSIQIKNLVFATQYEAVIEAENEAGDKETSDSIRFITIKDEFPPKISKVNNESTLYPGEETKIQTIVSWNTDEPSLCQFFYHESLVLSGEPSSFLQEEDYVADHVQVITAFAPATVYKFWVLCEDKTGNTSRSEDFVLFTPQKEKSIIDIIIENFEGSFGWLKNLGR